MTEYFKGELVTFLTQFLLTGMATDPQYVLLSLYPPDGPIRSYGYTPTGSSLSRMVTGTFHKDIFVDRSGQWWYRWESSGTVFSVDEDFFTVALSPF